MKGEIHMEKVTEAKKETKSSAGLRCITGRNKRRVFELCGRSLTSSLRAQMQGAFRKGRYSCSEWLKLVWDSVGGLDEDWLADGG